MMATQYDQNTLMAIAQNLPDLERQILQALKEKGMGLALDVAVRILKFPEDVIAPLRELQAKGLVAAQIVRGQFGGELYSLTLPGEQVTRLLSDANFSPAPLAAAAAVAAPPSPRQSEAELLKTLGDLSKEKGELDKAVDYYQQALDITRELTGGAK